MEPILWISLIMIWIAVAMIMYMAYLGYDVRSRGFQADGPAFATLPKLGITIREYYRKKVEHPVTDGDLHRKAIFCLAVMIIALCIFAAGIVIIIVNL
ncbi:MAG: hypothetical protein J5673_03235 [Candidatus Methanomethylophilaceae archaeon]|nr:hypothetical protein [Candidatus Methanomethylophilaceae archaeon]